MKIICTKSIIDNKEIIIIIKGKTYERHKRYNTKSFKLNYSERYG